MKTVIQSLKSWSDTLIRTPTPNEQRAYIAGWNNRDKQEDAARHAHDDRVESTVQRGGKVDEQGRVTTER